MISRELIKEVLDIDVETIIERPNKLILLGKDGEALRCNISTDEFNRLLEIKKENNDSNT